MQSCCKKGELETEGVETSSQGSIPLTDYYDHWVYQYCIMTDTIGAYISILLYNKLNHLLVIYFLISAYRSNSNVHHQAHRHAWADPSRPQPSLSLTPQTPSTTTTHDPTSRTALYSSSSCSMPSSPPVNPRPALTLHSWPLASLPSSWNTSSASSCIFSSRSSSTMSVIAITIPVLPPVLSPSTPSADQPELQTVAVKLIRLGLFAPGDGPITSRLLARAGEDRTEPSFSSLHWDVCECKCARRRSVCLCVWVSERGLPATFIKFQQQCRFHNILCKAEVRMCRSESTCMSRCPHVCVQYGEGPNVSVHVWVFLHVCVCRSVTHSTAMSQLERLVINSNN